MIMCLSVRKFHIVEDFILYHISYYDTTGPLNLKTQFHCIPLVCNDNKVTRHKHIICCLPSKINQSVNQRVG